MKVERFQLRTLFNLDRAFSIWPSSSSPNNPKFSILCCKAGFIDYFSLARSLLFQTALAEMNKISINDVDVKDKRVLIRLVKTFKYVF